MIMEFIDGGVCAPKGFQAAGIHCGIRKGKLKKDLSLIVSDVMCNAAAVYTQKQGERRTDRCYKRTFTGRQGNRDHLQQRECEYLRAQWRGNRRTDLRIACKRIEDQILGCHRMFDRCDRNADEH